MTLRVRAVRRETLGMADRARMLALMHLCYDGVDDARFAADLDAKTHVLVLRDAHGVLQGFSTIRMSEEMFRGRTVDILYSGDTVIHPDHWGTRTLTRGFITFLSLWRVRHLGRPLYWLLLSKGYRTYLLMTNNLPHAFPKCDVAPDPELVALRDRIASSWWGTQFDAQTSLVRFDVPRDFVKAGVAPVDDRARNNPHVRFFLEKNPHWQRGDELVCFALLDFGAPVRLIQKMLRRRR